MITALTSIPGQEKFLLQTNHTSYAFAVLPTGQLEHLYYGKKLTLPMREGQVDENALRMLFAAMEEKHEFPCGNVNVYDNAHTHYSLEDMRLEMSSLGKGDIREPFAEIEYADGSRTSDFVYEACEITQTKPEFATLPGSYSEDGTVPHLTITLADRNSLLKLELHYYVYPECDVISRSAKLVNASDSAVTVHRLMSMQLDLDESNYSLTTFQGAWAREMQKNTQPIVAGTIVNSSVAGATSSRSNSFVMLHRNCTTEDAGEAYGFHLIYSGNHYEAAQVSSFGKLRIVTGINPLGFAFCVAPGEDFETPEAVMTYSAAGFNGMSGNLHRFIRNHIVRGEWKDKVRPVLLNSWEAAYFKINEEKLMKLAKAGKDVGIELFVMDDGWFGKREDDTSSLGDWEVNEKKLPGGLKRLAERLADIGMQFGIWVEPEMVSVNSNLYRQHPEWVMEIPGKNHTEGRNQRILDLSNPEVCEFLIEKMSEVFASANISYVKWDMNRIFSDVYSQYLPKERQGEVAHRYICGLYACMKELTKRFPHILFEGCAAGGNRFDLGILSYFPQIWGSDDTDALSRAYIQTGYSYGYPLSCVSAHVSGCPNHQTLRKTPLDTRFAIAAFGSLGYECNLCDMSKEELTAIREQIALYKEWREVLQKGDFYRGRTLGNMQPGANRGQMPDTDGNLMEWTCVSEDCTKAVGLLFQKLVIPNNPNHIYFAKGLAPEKKYVFYGRELKYDLRNFGDLINTVSPVHLNAEGKLVDMIAKFVKMDGEKESYSLSGELLMQAGVHLCQAFAATGYNDRVRYFADFAARMYFMKALPECQDTANNPVSASTEQA